MFGIGSNYKYLFFQLTIIGLCILASLIVKPLVFVVFGISAYSISKDNDRNVFCQLFFILPFAMIYKLAPSSSSFFAYTLLFYAFFLIIHDKVRLDNILVLSIYLLLGSISSIETWAKLVSGFVVLSYFIDKTTQRNIRDYVICFAIGLIASSIIGLYKQDWPILQTYFVDLNEELMDGEVIARFSGLYGDPNYYSISLIIAVYFLLSYFNKKTLNRYFLISVTATLIYFGFLTYSKMYMLAIFIVIISQFKDYVRTSKYQLIAFVAVLFVVFYSIDSFLSSDYFLHFSARIDKDNISTNRFSVWSEYLSYLWDDSFSLLFGVGFGSPFYKGHAPHNSYIESLYFLGVFGSIIYIITLSKIIGSKRLVATRTWDNYFVLVIFMMMIGTLGVLTFNDIWLYYMLIWGAMNNDNEYVKRQ